MQLLADASWPDLHMAFATINCSTYEKSTTANCQTYEKMMALAWDTHQQALVAGAILEECMERMSHSTSH